MKNMHIVKGVYYDSVTLMLVARELKQIEDVREATLNIATPANIAIMRQAGFEIPEGAHSPDDLLVGLDCPAERQQELFQTARTWLASPPWKKESEKTTYQPKSLDGALSILPEANLALVSIAGRYAAAEATKALERGRNVMLYSDNVSLEDEIRLKQLAHSRGLIVMGPDCGTAVINGKGLGFSNACPTGPVGIVSASGTGLQEVMVQLARRGIGVKHGLGTGGRDVKTEVGGISFVDGLNALARDPDIQVLVAIGKPPAAEVRARILATMEQSGKAGVACFMGDRNHPDAPPVFFATQLEECAQVVSVLLEKGKQVDKATVKQARQALFGSYPVPPPHERKDGYLKGLFTGGTLCYEAQFMAQPIVGPVWSNAPLHSEQKVQGNSLSMAGHCMVDYGEDEFTQGRLHPMIDPSLRTERLLEQLKDPMVGVILFDVVLGYGSAAQPVDELVAALQQAGYREGSSFPTLVCSICGTEEDPQVLSAQRTKLKQAGVKVFESNAAAALFAALLAQSPQGKEEKNG